ncbi:MAG: hypothetical protein ACYDCY_08695 [Metallibacterium sp.]
MLTPSQISKKPKVMPLIVSDYNFETQARGMMMAGNYTSSSVQTFDVKGKPTDSKSDHND